MSTQMQPARRAATSKRRAHRDTSTARITSTAHVNNGAEGGYPIIPCGIVNVMVRLGGYTFDVEYALYTERPQASFFAVTMTRPTGDKLYPFELDVTRELTFDDLRALTSALPLIVAECERKMPAVEKGAWEIAETIERLGLNDR